MLSSTTVGKAWPLRGRASRSVLSIHKGLQKSVVDKEATDQAQKNPKKIVKILLKGVDKIVKVWYYNSVKRGTQDESLHSKTEQIRFLQWTVN